MIKIIMVDDDNKIEKEVKQIIKKISFKISDDFEVKSFNEYNKDLLKEIKDVDTKKIYILDVDLKTGKSGVDIAEIIRKDDWESEIIFLTNHDNLFTYVHKSVFGVFDFIEKFMDYEKRLEKSLLKIVDRNFDNKILKYSSKNVELNIFYRNIKYIYRDTVTRKLNVVTTGSTFVVNMNITEMLSKLDERFKLCHRACIVNTDKVEEYNFKNKLIKLDTGEEIDYLSKAKRNELCSTK